MISDIAKRLEMDNYDLEAVFTPTIVNLLIPYFVFMSTLFPYMHNAYWWKSVITITTSLATVVIATRFVMNLFRATSRIFEDILYRKDRLRFPTTSMLLFSDHSISQEMKMRVRNILMTKYNMKLCSKAKEKSDEMEARRTAKDAVSIIRTIVADTDNPMIRRKLIRYGCFRNFLGGAIYCLLFCIVCWAIDYTNSGNINTIITITIIIYVTIIAIVFFLLRVLP